MRTIEIEGAKSLDDVKKMTVDSPPVTPIVFVPGVMGSRLTFKGAKWDPDKDILGLAPSNMLWWAGLDPMKSAELLDIRGGDKAATMNAPIPHDGKLEGTWKIVDPEERKNFYGDLRGWSGVSRDYYYDLLVSLETFFNTFPFEPGAHPVYAFGYDWRRSNAASGKDLADKITAVSNEHGGAKVVVVTHSMGGLVARHACHPKGGNAGDLIKGIVHVVQPVNGAVQAYRRFAEGVDADREGGIEGKVMAGILGGSWWGYTLLMSGMDGPLQLLPNHVYGGWLRDEGGDPVPASDIYAYYASGTPESLNPGLQTEFARKLSYNHMGDADKWLDNTAEQYILANGLPWSDDEIEKARAKRVLDRWASYRQKLSTGIKNMETFHKLVAGTLHPHTFMLYAADHETEVGYNWSKKRGSRVVKASPGGDGTVPVGSARGLDTLVAKAWKKKLPEVLAAHENVGAQEHSAVFGDAAVLDKVRLLVYFLIRLEKVLETKDECVISTFEVACEHKASRKLSLMLPPAKGAKSPSNVIEVVAADSGHAEKIEAKVTLGKPRCELHQDEMFVVKGPTSTVKKSGATATLEFSYSDKSINTRLPGWIWPWDAKPASYLISPKACHPATIDALVRVFPAVKPSISFEFKLETDDRVEAQIAKAKKLGRVEKRGRPAQTEWTIELKAKVEYGSRTVELSKSWEGKIRELAAVNRMMKKAIDRFSEVFFKFTGVTLLPVFPCLSLAYEGEFKEIPGSCRVGAEWKITFKADPLIGLTAKIEILEVLIDALEKTPVAPVAAFLDKVRQWAKENDQTFEILLTFTGTIGGEVGGKKSAEKARAGFFGAIEGKLTVEFSAKASFGSKGFVSFELGAEVKASTGIFAKLEADNDMKGVFLKGKFGISACKLECAAWASGKVFWEVKESIKGEYKFWDDINLVETPDMYVLKSEEPE